MCKYFNLLAFSLRIFPISMLSHFQCLCGHWPSEVRGKSWYNPVYHTVSLGKTGAVSFILDPLLPPRAAHSVFLLQNLPEWSCLPSLNKAGISLLVNSEVKVTGHQDREMSHVFPFSLTAYKSGCEVSPPPLLVSASLCFSSIVHS